ncbi:MAG TPA: chemotaxis response regulator protein-glutamate methylesterase [Polyangiaceae bacterium]|nr:chemotaxis response regulator protein-glutamate methylesterase [Polyangiaceae bacterium]
MSSPSRPKIRVLIVDDSAFMRTAIARLIGSDARFTVVGQARDGQEAVQLARALEPDVITMDFNMPGMNGAQATRAILSHRPRPIVMLSAHTRQGAVETMEALTAGAVDFVPKPAGEVSASLSAIRETLLSKLALVASANLAPARRAEPLTRPPAPARPAAPAPRAVAVPAGPRIIVIASSTGGPAALVRVLSRLKLGKKAAALLVQHMPMGFTEALALQLAEHAAFPVREARSGDRLEPGIALLAPGGTHLVVERSGSVTLRDGPPVHGVKPAADVTLRSVAEVYGARSVGVVLTGMGRDGALGLAAIKAAGGRTAAQDRASSIVYGMPRAALELGVVEDVVTLDQIGSYLTQLIN